MGFLYRMSTVWANDDYALSNFSVIQSSLVRVMPTIPYLICSQLVWFSLFVKIHIEWFIKLFPKTPKGQPAGLGETFYAEFYFVWNIATLCALCLFAVEEVQSPSQAGPKLCGQVCFPHCLLRTPEHAFLPVLPLEINHPLLHLFALPFKAFQTAV